MNIPKKPMWLAFFAVLVAGACDDSGMVAPLDEELTLEDEIALQTLEDPVAIRTALELASPGTSASPWQGIGGGMASQETEQVKQARLHFDAAREALQMGDRWRAAQESRKAREFVSKGIMTSRGVGAIKALVERMEDLSLTVVSDSTQVQGSETLGSQMSMLSGWARESMGRGDFSSAGALGVLGEQRMRQYAAGNMGLTSWTGGTCACHGLGWGNGGTWGCNGSGWWNHTGGTNSGLGEEATLMVALGGTAVNLATQILSGTSADEGQTSYLGAAAETQALAEAALLAGDLSQASYLAGLAQWQALKSIVLPGGITAEDAQAMLELAQALYEQAQAAISDPDALQSDLLRRAGAMIAMGQSNMNTWSFMCINPLWRAAVISAWLIA